jgi:hypothetical protein
MLYELDELEMFRQYVADNALEFLAHKPERLQDLFDHLRAYYRDHDRLVVLDEIEAMAQDFATVPAETTERTEVRRRRKPSLDKLIAKAKVAGARSVVVEGVEMRSGDRAVEQPNDLDKWMAKRHAH